MGLGTFQVYIFKSVTLKISTNIFSSTKGPRLSAPECTNTRRFSAKSSNDRDEMMEKGN